jgi:mono/diheme cytochrome c family protein
MAQDSKPSANGDDSTPKGSQLGQDDDDGHYHYYSGGEVKELADTRVPPALWIFYYLLIFCAIISIFWLGALGPRLSPTGPYRPPNGSFKELSALQAQLNLQAFPADTSPSAEFDLSRIAPQGQSVAVAIDKGSDVYQTYCFGCHGPNQDGNGVNAASLNPKPRNLRDAPFMQAMSFQRILTSIHKGVPGTAMPRWENSLTEIQMRDAACYVLSLTSPKMPDLTAIGTAGGANQFTGQSMETSPKPITPPINGNPAGGSNTSPPSASGQPNRPATSGGAPTPPAQ